MVPPYLSLSLSQQKMVSGIREHFVENVYATLRVVAMPTEGGALDRFLAGSPSQVTGDSAKIAKSASKGVRTLQVSSGVGVVNSFTLTPPMCYSEISQALQ